MRTPSWEEEPEPELTPGKSSFETDRGRTKISGNAIFVIILLGVLVLLLLLVWTSGLNKESQESIRASEQEYHNRRVERENSGTDEQISTLWQTGFLKRINPEMNEAFVDPTLWTGIDYQTKQNISRSLAFYCGRTKGTNLNWVIIYDNMSGKKLAKFSEAWGFKVY
jgi:hypothetical protein